MSIHDKNAMNKAGNQRTREDPPVNDQPSGNHKG